MNGPSRGETLDPTAFLGFFLAMTVVTGSVWLGDGLFRPAPALAFVLLGAVASVWLAHGPESLLRAVRLTGRTLYRRSVPADLWVEYMCAVSWSISRGGLLALEPVLEEIPEPFLHQKLQFFMDGVARETSERVLENRTTAMEEQQRNDQSLLTAASAGMALFGGWALVFGLWSSQPVEAALWPLAWGMLAIVFLSALRAKLRRLGATQRQQKQMLARAFDAIQEGDNPYMLHIRMNMYLPADRRLSPEEMKHRLCV